METVNEEEIDTLATLEQRIQRAVEVLNSLRSEQQDLTQQLAAARDERDRTRHDLEETRKQLSTSEAQAEQLSQDVAHLREERKQVKGRIEKLLGQMDLLSAR
jgi:chromosome segregation protein